MPSSTPEGQSLDQAHASTHDISRPAYHVGRFNSDGVIKSEPHFGSPRRRALRMMLLALGLALGLMVALQGAFSAVAAPPLTPALSQGERGHGTISPAYSQEERDLLQEDTNYADVVVDFGAGRVEVRRVTFVSPTISSLEALRLSGIDAGIADFDFGAAVCAIDKLGCALDNCFCDPNQYWGLFRLQDGQWIASQVGAANSTVEPGDVDGWHWGPFESTAAGTTRVRNWRHRSGLSWLRSQQAADGSFGGNDGRNSGHGNGRRGRGREHSPLAGGGWQVALGLPAQGGGAFATARGKPRLGRQAGVDGGRGRPRPAFLRRPEPGGQHEPGLLAHHWRVRQARTGIRRSTCWAGGRRARPCPSPPRRSWFSE